MIQNPFRTFKNIDYSFYWIFNTLSLVGSWIDFTLRQWLVVEMIKGERLAAQFIGIYNLVRFIPSFLFSLIAGYVSDKYDSRLILWIINLLDFLNACIISYLVYTNKLNPVNFLFLALFLGITSSFYFPSRSKLINSIVRDKNDIPSSFSWQGISFNFSRIVGPIIAGYLAKYFGIFWGFILNAFSYIPLIIYLSLLNRNIRVKVNKGDYSGSSIFQDLGNTIKYIISNKKLVRCFYSIFTINFWGISLFSFLQVFVKEVLKENINYFAILVSLLGLGSIIGAFIVASINYQIILSFKEEIFILIYGGLIFLLSVFPNFSWFIIFFIGFFQALVFGFTNNKLQILTDESNLGKVVGIYSIFNISLSYLGVFVISNFGFMLGILNLFKVVPIFIIFSAIMIGLKAKEG